MGLGDYRGAVAANLAGTDGEHLAVRLDIRSRCRMVRVGCSAAGDSGFTRQGEG